MRDPRALVAIKVPRIVAYDLLDLLDKLKSQGQGNVNIHGSPDVKVLHDALNKLVAADK